MSFLVLLLDTVDEHLTLAGEVETLVHLGCDHLDVITLYDTCHKNTDNLVCNLVALLFLKHNLK